MRIPVIAANWKMNKTNAEARQFITDFAPLVEDVDGVDIILAPPFTSLAVSSKYLKGTNIKLGAQNVYHEKEGAYTGEISADMLIDCGCLYVIIGHSERRHYFNETDEMINKKIKTALQSGLEVILCVGETLDERESNKTFDIISRQIEKGIDGIDLSKIIIAYEPVWAIGTGKTASPEQAQEVHSYIREKLRNYGSAAEGIRILYGGSVKPDNIGSLMEKGDIDGALVGGASLDPVGFSQIVKYNMRRLN